MKWLPFFRVDRSGAVRQLGIVGPQQLGSRTAVLDYVRSHPDGLAGSLVALYLDKHFRLLAMDRIG